MELNRSNYTEACIRGELLLPHILAPFINVDPKKYSALESKSRPLNFDKISKRYGERKFQDIRVAVSQTWHTALTYFPAYRFQAMEYINDEWLATLDYHKDFHRDHVSHQVYSYYVTRTLLAGKDLSGYDSTFDLRPNGKTFREHIIDAILQCEKGRYLLNACKEMGVPSRYWKDTTSPVTRYLWGTLIDETLALACYFHDIGYPWQFVNFVESLLGQHQPGVRLSLIDNAMLMRFKNRLMGTPFDGYEPPGRTQPIDREQSIRCAFSKAACDTHGLPGAVVFLHLNDVLRRFPDPNDSPVKRFCLEWAAMAIMMHDLEGIYAKDSQKQLRIDFARDPLSFMLTLADQIQDFDRPNADFLDGKATLNGSSASPVDVNLKYVSKCSGVYLNWAAQLKRLTISFMFANPVERLMNRTSFKKKAQRQYFDPINGYLDYSSPALGIDSIQLDVP